MNTENEKAQSVFNIGSQTANRIVNMGSEDQVKQLEQQVSDLETALIISQNSRKFQKERADNLEAKVKKYEEALREIVSECKNEKSDLLDSIHKIEEIATEALKPE